MLPFVIGSWDRMAMPGGALTPPQDTVAMHNEQHDYPSKKSTHLISGSVAQIIPTLLASTCGYTHPCTLEHRRLYNNMALVVQGEPGHKLYFIRSGLLQVRVARSRASFRQAFALTRSITGCRNLANARALQDDPAFAGSGVPLMQLLSSMVGRSMRTSTSIPV